MEAPNGEAEGPLNTNDHGKDDVLDDKTVTNGNFMSDEYLEGTRSKYAGFWSPELKSTRKQVCAKWTRTGTKIFGATDVEHQLMIHFFPPQPKYWPSNSNC
jgi:hypothetical protein